MLKHNNKILSIKSSGKSVLDHDIVVPAAAARGYAAGELIPKGTSLIDIITKEFTAAKAAITVVSSDITKGTVSGGGTFDVGSVIAISATPLTGYEFEKWNDGNSQNPRSITVTSAQTFIANFILASYSITVTNDGQGTGSAYPASAQPGTEITLVPSPNAGKQFKAWEVVTPSTLVITNNKFTMPSENVIVNATFEDSPVPTYDITITCGAGGSTNPVGPTVAVQQGASQTITAVPATGYEVDTLIVDGTTQTAGATSYTFTNVQAGHTFNVTFKLLPVKVTVKGIASPAAAIASGCKVTVNGKDGEDEVNKGDSVTIIAVAGGSYRFKQWNDGDINASRTITAESDVTWTATFEEIVTHIVTISSGEGGSTSPTGTQSVQDGGSISVVATANTGYTLDKWKLDGAEQAETSTTFTLNNVTADHTVEATFKVAETYKIYNQAYINSGRTPITPTADTLILGDATVLTAEELAAKKATPYSWTSKSQSKSQECYCIESNVGTVTSIINALGIEVLNNGFYTMTLTKDGVEYKLYYNGSAGSGGGTYTITLV